jgi:hypothetical protein
MSRGRSVEITITRDTPEGFAVASAGRELIKGNRAPYYHAGVDVWRSRRAYEIGAEPTGSALTRDELIAAYFPELAPIAAMHLAWSDTGEPMHAPADGWYWLSGSAAARTVESRERPYGHDPEYGRVPHHLTDDGELSPAFMAAYVERAARALRVSVEDLPDVQDERLFDAWVDEHCRPRWQAEADATNALIDRLSALHRAAEVSPAERSEESCTITIGEGSDRISVRAWQPEGERREAYRDGVGAHYVYRVVVRAAGTSYSTTYGGSVADHEAGRHDARGACNCVLGELRDALSYSSGDEWAREFGDDCDRATVRALDRCVKAAERMRSTLEANMEVIGS